MVENSNPYTITVANGRCTSLPIPVAIEAGKSPNIATEAVINTGRKRCFAPFTTADNKSKTITDYIATTKDLRCDIDASIYSYTKKDTSIIYYGVIYKISFGRKDDTNSKQWEDFVNTYDNGNTIIHFQNKEHSDFTTVITTIQNYNFRQDYDYVKLNDLINKVQYNDLPNVAISVINGIEAYVNIKNKNMSGIRKRTTN